MTYEEWEAQGAALFGPDRMGWRFRCPACRHVASAADWKAAGAPASAIAFSCVGRWTGQKRRAFGTASEDQGPGPCDYAGGGLFQIAPVHVEGRGGRYFAFATETTTAGSAT